LTLLGIVLGAVLAPVLTAFGILYRDGVKSKDLQIADLNTRLTEATDSLRQSSTAMGEAVPVVRSRASGRRR
jgi:hypothetical protein